MIDKIKASITAVIKCYNEMKASADTMRKAILEIWRQK